MPRLARRYIWIAAGAVALGLGAAGVLLPLLPTTPFLILAAYCFSRGSPKLHAWLVNHRIFGPPIRDWREHRAISRAAKCSAIVAIALVFAVSAVLRIPGWALAVQGLVLSGVALYLLSRPEPPNSSLNGD